MHRITKIELAGMDPKTHSAIKLIYTTASEEPFYTKTCCYNQMFERYEKTMTTFGGQRLEAPPITTRTLKYLTHKDNRSTLLSIKELTSSRKSKDQTLFLLEAESIKKIAATNTKVVLFYFQITDKDWEVYTIEDMETLARLLIVAGVPHVTMPLHPRKTFVENAEYFTSIKKALKEGQTLAPQFHPSMKKGEGEQILQKCFADDKCMITLFTGLSPNVPSHSYYYSYCWDHHPTNKLLHAADVQDSFGDKHEKLPTHLALRRFGFDMTCRKITFPVSAAFNFPTPPERNLIYDDNTAGLLAETEQRIWHGKSVTDFILENFPANTGLDFREYVLAFNFTALNRTGLKEADKIAKKKHEEYILARLYLQAYWSKT